MAKQMILKICVKHFCHQILLLNDYMVCKTVRKWFKTIRLYRVLRLDQSRKWFLSICGWSNQDVSDSSSPTYSSECLISAFITFFTCQDRASMGVGDWLFGLFMMSVNRNRTWKGPNFQTMLLRILHKNLDSYNLKIFFLSSSLYN